jgi:hypothetical protein
VRGWKLSFKASLAFPKREDFEKFFSTKIRMTLIQVSADAKYDPSLVPNLPARH